MRVLFETTWSVEARGMVPCFGSSSTRTCEEAVAYLRGLFAGLGHDRTVVSVSFMITQRDDGVALHIFRRSGSFAAMTAALRTA